MCIFNRKRIFRLLGMAGITALLMMAGVLLLSMAALSQGRKSAREQKEYYKAMEQEYMEQMRSLLEEEGYLNSGITMNRVIDEDESLSYVVTIHHKGISGLDDRQRQELLSKCEEIEFPDRDCSFCHRFLETSF